MNTLKNQSVQKRQGITKFFANDSTEDVLSSKLYTLHQVITLYQLTHSLISPYKKSTEKLYKLDNAEVVCVIPELDASSSVGDGVGSKTGLEGAVEIKLNDGVTITEKKTLTLLYAQRNTSMRMRFITLTSWKQLCSLFYNQLYQVFIRKQRFSFCYYRVHLVHGYF